MPQVDLERLAAYLRGREDVILAVVFGSGQDGKIGPESDLDLAVLFDRSPEPATMIRFMTDAAEEAGFDRLDLVDLHRADPILAFEALSGRVLCKNDPGRAAEYSSLICREYESTMQRLERAA